MSDQKNSLEIQPGASPDVQCCQAVNDARKEFLNQLNLFLDGFGELPPEEYQKFIQTVDFIKTLAFKAYAKLLKIEVSVPCCQLASSAISQTAIFFLELLSVEPLRVELSPEQCEAYVLTLKAILAAAKNEDCCPAIIGFIQQYLGLGASPGYFNILSDFARALKILSKNLRPCLPEPECCNCQDYADALFTVSQGTLNILTNLTQAALPPKQYLTAEQLEEESDIERKKYQEVLVQILDLAQAIPECNKCCEDVLNGISKLFVNSTEIGDIALPVYYLNTVDQNGPQNFPNNLGPNQELIQQLYRETYLVLLRQIRQCALEKYKLISTQTTEEACCEVIANSLADSTNDFVASFAQVFVDLVGQAQNEDKGFTLEYATDILYCFANEYPPLVQQIIEPLKLVRNPLCEKCPSSSSSSSSCTSHKSEKTKTCSCKSSSHHKECECDEEREEKHKHEKEHPFKHRYY